MIAEKLGNKAKIIPGINCPDLASFIKADLAAYAKENHKVALTIKYLDPKNAIIS